MTQLELADKVKELAEESEPDMPEVAGVLFALAGTLYAGDNNLFRAFRHAAHAAAFTGKERAVASKPS